jgi:hypothetical protein
MKELDTYHIEIRGQIDAAEANSRSPLHVTVEQTGPTATRLAVYTDQSGLIGLLRHLHARGFVLISVYHQLPS